MSPEQARSPRDVDHRTDLYSVGRHPLRDARRADAVHVGVGRVHGDPLQDLHDRARAAARSSARTCPRRSRPWCTARCSAISTRASRRRSTWPRRWSPSPTSGARQVFTRLRSGPPEPDARPAPLGDAARRGRAREAERGHGAHLRERATALAPAARDRRRRQPRSRRARRRAARPRALRTGDRRRARGDRGRGGHGRLRAARARAVLGRQGDAPGRRRRCRPPSPIATAPPVACRGALGPAPTVVLAPESSADSAARRAPGGHRRRPAPRAPRPPPPTPSDHDRHDLAGAASDPARRPETPLRFRESPHESPPSILAARPGRAARRRAGPRRAAGRRPAAVDVRSQLPDAARKAWDAAKQLAGASDFRGALVEFQRAYELSHNAARPLQRRRDREAAHALRARGRRLGEGADARAPGSSPPPSSRS